MWSIIFLWRLVTFTTDQRYRNSKSSTICSILANVLSYLTLHSKNYTYDNITFYIKNYLADKTNTPSKCQFRSHVLTKNIKWGMATFPVKRYKTLEQKKNLTRLKNNWRHLFKNKHSIHSVNTRYSETSENQNSNILLSKGTLWHYNT